MNLIENINRIKQMMGLLNEVVDLPQDSYLTMNIKNFPAFKKEFSEMLKDKLDNSQGDFLTFKQSVIKGYDRNKIPILSDDLEIDNRYVNFMKSMGSKRFNSLLYSIFSSHFGVKSVDSKTQSDVIDCDPSDFEIVGPLVAKDKESLLSYWVNQEGGKVYRIKLPQECLNQMTSDERNIYLSIEPIENRIHFPKGVPERLRGKKLGTLIYLAMINKLGYLTSSMGNSPEIKMVWQDLVTNPKYKDDIMSLVLQKQILVFDKNADQDVVKIFNEFVSNKFTDKKSVRISPSLKEVLGDNFTSWYNSLDESAETSIEDKIKKYEGVSPSHGDTVVDTTTGKIYSFSGEWEGDNGMEMQLNSDKYETLLLPVSEKSRFKVIHRYKTN